MRSLAAVERGIPTNCYWDWISDPAAGIVSQLVIYSERVFRDIDPKVSAFCEHPPKALNFAALPQPIGMHFGPDPAATAGKSFGLRIECKAFVLR
jgi:hypothetical protein